mgnify:FL=1
MVWFDVVKRIEYTDLMDVLEQIQQYLEEMLNFAEVLVRTPKRNNKTKLFSSAPAQWGPISESINEYQENLADFKLNLRRLLSVEGLPVVNLAKGVRLWLSEYDWDTMQSNIMELYSQRKHEFGTNPYFREREAEMTLPVPPDWNLVQNVLNSPDLENIR